MSVICLGEALFDLLANQPGVSLAQVTAWTAYPGGAPTNVACGLAKLGTKVALISCLGRDSISINIVELLTKAKVDLTGLQYHPTAPTRQIYVTRSIDGDRTFAGFINNLATDKFADTYLAAELIPEALFKAAKFLLIGTISLATPISSQATHQALAFAHKYQLQVLVDVNWRSMFWSDSNQAKVTILELLSQVNFVKMSDEEADWLFNSIDPQVIHQKLPNSQGIFITAGSQGCRYLLNNLTGFVPAFDVKAIDTTGAGDSFVAALIYQLSKQDIRTIQDNETIIKIVKYAAAAGAITTLKTGAIDAQPTDVEVLEFMSTHTINL